MGRGWPKKIRWFWAAPRIKPHTTHPVNDSCQTQSAKVLAMVPSQPLCVKSGIRCLCRFLLKLINRTWLGLSLTEFSIHHLIGELCWNIQTSVFPFNPSVLLLKSIINHKRGQPVKILFKILWTASDGMSKQNQCNLGYTCIWKGLFLALHRGTNEREL